MPFTLGVPVCPQRIAPLVLAALVVLAAPAVCRDAVPAPVIARRLIETTDWPCKRVVKQAGFRTVAAVTTLSCRDGHVFFGRGGRPADKGTGTSGMPFVVHVAAAEAFHR